MVAFRKLERWASWLVLILFSRAKPAFYWFTGLFSPIAWTRPGWLHPQMEQALLVQGFSLVVFLWSYKILSF
jgi:hypothetical protein